MEQLKTNCIPITLSARHFGKLSDANPYSFDAAQYGSYKLNLPEVKLEINCYGTIHDCLCRVSFAGSCPKDGQNLSPAYVPVPNLGYFWVRNVGPYDHFIVNGLFNKLYFDENNYEHVVRDIIYKTIEQAIDIDIAIFSELIEIADVVYGYTDNGEEGILKFKLPFPALNKS